MLQMGLCRGVGENQVIAVLTQVWVLLGFSVSSRKAASGRVQPSVQVRLSVTQDVGPRGRAGGTSDHFHPSFKCVFAFSPEVVHVGFEMQLEHIVLVDVLRL